MKSEQHTKSSEQLKQEVLEGIDKVEMDIDEMVSRLTPGQIIDDAVFYSHKRNLGDTFDFLKRNPVGAGFLAIGTMLLMEDENQESYEHKLRRNASSGISQTKDKVSSLKQTFNDKKDELKQKVQRSKGSGEEVDFGAGVGTGAGSDLTSTDQFQVGASDSQGYKARTSEFKEEVQSKAGEIKEGLEDKRGELKSTMQSKGQELKEKFGAKRGEIKENLNSTISSARETMREIDPLAFAAIGAGLGILTGASLPVSEKERDLVGQRLSAHKEGLKSEIQEALNKGGGVLKDAIFNDVKNFDVKFFKGAESQQDASPSSS